VNPKRRPKAPRKFTYAQAGVDRTLRAQSKRALTLLSQTYKFSQQGPIAKLPYGNIFPISEDLYLDLNIEGVGTKVLVAQLANKYDTIGIDGVAMAVNDTIRSGATPIALVDNIHAHVSDPALVQEWLKGIVKGAEEARCLVPSGEIGDMPDLIKGLVEGKGFDMIVASVGLVHKEHVVFASNLKQGDIMVGLRSSGIHSNGISLARRVLFKEWGGKYEPFEVPDNLERELVYEVLEPTRIYVKPLQELVCKDLVKAAIHITGDAYLKFDRLMKLNKKIGFEFDNFRPQPIFHVIQKTSDQQKRPISDREMFQTFNMGWGFAVVVDKASKEETIESLARNAVEAEEIGKVTNSGKILIKHEGEKIELKR
jgi:phosphoribosylformylglycinamidine cyclo-ligase